MVAVHSCKTSPATSDVWAGWRGMGNLSKFPLVRFTPRETTLKQASLCFYFYSRPGTSMPCPSPICSQSAAPRSVPAADWLTMCATLTLVTDQRNHGSSHNGVCQMPTPLRWIDSTEPENLADTVTKANAAPPLPRPCENDPELPAHVSFYSSIAILDGFLQV